MSEAINKVLYNVDQTADTTSAEKAQARANIGAQGALTAGSNISIVNDTISAVDTTYSAGTGLDLNDTTFSVDTDVIQEKLTAGSNITIDGTTISATDTKYTAGNGLNLNGTQFSVDTAVVQEKLTAGNNVQINGSTISATDTTYSAGTNVQISDANVISATDTKYTAGNGLSLSNTEFSADTSVLQEKLTAGSNIQINGNTISATDTTYSAGSNVQISNANVISATDTKYTAGNGLSLSNTEFSVDTSTIQSKLTAGSNITINGSTISATDTDTHRPINVNGTQVLGDNTTALNLKSGTNVTVSANGGDVTISATQATVDQTYNASSSNAQSGTAVAGAIATKQNSLPTSGTATDTYAINISGGANTANYAVSASDYSAGGSIATSLSGLSGAISTKQGLLPTSGTPTATYAINITGHADSADAATWAAAASAAQSGSTLETQVNNGLAAYKETYTNVTLIQGDIYTNTIALEVGQENSPGNGVRLFLNNNTGSFDVDIRSNTWNSWMDGGQVIWMLQSSYGVGSTSPEIKINNDTVTLSSIYTQTKNIGTIDMGGTPGQYPVNGSISGRFYFISPTLVSGLLNLDVSFNTDKSTTYGGMNSVFVVGKAEWVSFADHKVTAPVV